MAESAHQCNIPSEVVRHQNSHAILIGKVPKSLNMRVVFLAASLTAGTVVQTHYDWSVIGQVLLRLYAE